MLECMTWKHLRYNNIHPQTAVCDDDADTCNHLYCFNQTLLYNGMKSIEKAFAFNVTPKTTPHSTAFPPTGFAPNEKFLLLIPKDFIDCNYNI